MYSFWAEHVYGLTHFHYGIQQLPGTLLVLLKEEKSLLELHDHLS